jgi:hypothetical protein
MQEQQLPQEQGQQMQDQQLLQRGLTSPAGLVCKHPPPSDMHFTISTLATVGCQSPAAVSIPAHVMRVLQQHSLLFTNLI